MRCRGRTGAVVSSDGASEAQCVAEAVCEGGAVTMLQSRAKGARGDDVL